MVVIPSWRANTCGSPPRRHPALLFAPIAEPRSDRRLGRFGHDTQLIRTGQIILEPKGGTLAGFVRCNARTIGSASSGATERANPLSDCVTKN
jgi:hypothetical protein